MSDFTDKVVLITGGNSGIGRAAALQFATAGAKVLIAARRLEESRSAVSEIATLGGDAHAVACDVTKSADCDAAVEACLDRFGGLDVLFNNAGIIYRDKSALDTTDDQWAETMAVNTTGTFFMSRAAVAVMAARGGGAIVNNASYFGLVGGRGAAAYCASKGAVVLLTKAMALDHARQRVRINCVCAGSVDTPMLRGEMEEMGGIAAVRPLFEEKHPIGRIATPEEIAAAVLYLASDEAGFITGAALPIDGGLTAG
jgi:NAD(P)-dependent dehydrogenase (short-subunit alcohol dehydrogenase family)